MMRSARLMVVWLVVTGWVGAAAGDAQQTFDMLFGTDLKKALATRDTKDDAALAATLMDAVGSAGQRSDLKVLLLHKAAELGAKDEAGFDTTAEAVKKLLELAPDRADEWQALLLPVYQDRFQSTRGEKRRAAAAAFIAQLVETSDAKLKAGKATEAVAIYRQALQLAQMTRSPVASEIVERIKLANAAAAAERRIEQLRSRLQKDPDDLEARKAVALYCLLELDRPSEAEKLLHPDMEEPLRTYIPLAAKEVQDVSDAACLELAVWYDTIRERAASPRAQLTALQRAGTYYQRYLATHEADDLTRLKAKVGLQKVAKALMEVGSQLGPQAAVAGRTLVLDLPKGVKMKLVLIPSGSFIMGSPASEKDRATSEGPQHEVTISEPFYMGVTEVTQEQYTAVMEANPSAFKGPNLPVEKVTWDDAVKYCSTLSAIARHRVRLPTEAEWEYACRAGTKTRFSFGDRDEDLHKYANYADRSCTKMDAQKDKAHSDGHDKTAPVGSFKPNPWGLYDMHGNVYEWCRDWCGWEYYAESKTHDPQGPDTPSRERVIRGGQWDTPPKCLRSAHRAAYLQGHPHTNYGFRVVIEVGGHGATR